MSNLKEIKQRIKSIKDTRKITNAMYLISSTEIKRAKKELEKTRPYFYSLQTEIKRIFRSFKELESPYLYPIDRNDFVDGTHGFLIITADKGLAGPYNSNVIKESKTISKHHDKKLFVAGEYGRQHFEKMGIDYVKDFHYSAGMPTITQAAEMANILLQQFESGEIKKLFIVYTDISEKSVATTKLTRLLPFHRDYFNDTKKDSEEKVENAFEFYSDANSILENIVESYLIGFIYGALVDSYTAELDYRMNSMKSANQNADNILVDLNIEHNRIRQSLITQEITEVSAGAKSMKDKLKNKKNFKEG